MSSRREVLVRILALLQRKTLIETKSRTLKCLKWHYSTVSSMKNVAVLTEDGTFALFFHPHPGDLTAQESPPREFAIPGKKIANVWGSARGGGGLGGMLGAGGIDWCISLKSFEGSVLESLASSDTSDIEIRKLELELELRKFDAQKEWELRELEFKERELREREKEREARIEKQRLDHELEMKTLEMQEKLGCSHPISSSGVKFDVSKYIK